MPLLMPPDELDELLTQLRAWADSAEYGEQKKLAEHLGITPQLLNHWITGRNLPSLRLGLKLQTFLKKQRRRRPKPRNPESRNQP
jgi:DNA-binding XRE family transcriptional regulator